MSLDERIPELTLERPRRRRLLAGAALVVAFGCAGTAVLILRDSGGHAAKQGTTLPTAGVVRTDLSEQTQMDGQLGFAHSYTIPGGSGRLTWLPQVGDVIRRGGRVYGTEGHSVPLFYASTPFWRALRYGVDDGPDVKELERNLKALGYDDDGAMTVDKHFSTATEQALKDFQHDQGMTRTGALSPGDVVTEPGSIRITKVDGILGAPGGGRVVTASDTTAQVTVSLPVTQENIAQEGAKVSVELPGGKVTGGHISTVGTVATAGSDDQTGQAAQTATIPVTIELDRPKDSARFDLAPVTVTFSTNPHKNVLAVPVNALLARADGSYAVNVVENGVVRPVAVQLGLFSGGQVEVTGEGLDAGMHVEVPRS